ncbi:MAG: hypothetical protein ACLQDL_18820 [Spirochaetia bacterium]
MESRKRLTDLRGPQSRIGRLLSFSFEAWLHMLTNRIMVFLSLLYAVLIVLYLLVPGLGTALKIVTAAVWLLWTPQFFEALKGLALVWSRGMAFGHLNEEFAHLYRKRYAKRTGVYAVFPFVVLAAWAAGFVVMLVRWFP